MNHLILYCVRPYGYQVVLMTDGNIVDEYFSDFFGSNLAQTKQYALQTAEEWRDQLEWDCEIAEDDELMDDMDEHYVTEEDDE